MNFMQYSILRSIGIEEFIVFQVLSLRKLSHFELVGTFHHVFIPLTITNGSVKKLNVLHPDSKAC